MGPVNSCIVGERVEVPMGFWLILSIFLILFGALMLIRPVAFWAMTEKWKSVDATEPSKLFLFQTRFGGAMCILAGTGGMIASMLGHS